jgi:conjugative transfer signal peptidase TraF
MRAAPLRAITNRVAALDARRGETRRMRRRGALFVVGLAGVAVTLVPLAHRPGLHFVWNASASVPIGLYRIAPGRAVRPGVLVALRPGASLARFMAGRHYLESGAVLVKPVAAVAGETVCRRGGLVTIGGVPVAVALSVDSRHRPLPVWSGCRRLPVDAVFLLASAVPDSFDSRYFGPVPRRWIVGRAIALWTRP